MTVVIAQVETRCPHEGCRWTFVGTALRGKAALPQHLHLAHGGRHAGEPQTPEPEPQAVVEVDQPVPAGTALSSSKWTRETVIAAIQAFAAEQGRTPTARDNGGLVIAAKRLFPSWGDAVVAAGFERPRRGHTNRIDAGVAQPERAPADQAGDAGSTPAPRSELPADRQPDAGTETTSPEREPTGQEPPDDDAGATALGPDDRPDPRDQAASPAEVASRSDDADDETGGALDLATLTNSDAHEWIARCDAEAERCTDEAARLVRRAKGFKTIGDGLRILQETTS